MSERTCEGCKAKVLSRIQPCGCIICYCSDPDQCHGCGAKNCGTHPIGEIPNPVYQSEALLEGREISWSRNEAELRGTCDYCKSERVLLSYNQQGLWNCFACFAKMDTPE